MTMVAESRDLETGAHIIRTKEYVVTLARALRRLGYYRDELAPGTFELLYRAAPLHDIGKVGIPDAILCKPGKLTEDEYRIMQSHVEIGRSIIQNAINNYSKTNDFLNMAANITYCHHERWDGGGYPRGIAGEEIPLEGRLMALADVLDALVSARYYKEEFSFAEAEEIIIAESGRHFDPRLVEGLPRQDQKNRPPQRGRGKGASCLKTLFLDKKTGLDLSNSYFFPAPFLPKATHWLNHNQVAAPPVFRGGYPA